MKKENDKLNLSMPGTIGSAKVVFKNDYQDVLSTEECALQALTDFAQENGLYDMKIEDNPLIKK
jgi:hypothetical protein